MKVVIQCAASKVHHAGSLRDADGTPVLFVARPDLAPHSGSCIYAHPDDPAGNGLTWRDMLVKYNNEYRHTGANPLELLQAYELYRHPVYRELVNRYGADRVFILSAGWGLINADFLTPKYDITFSASADRYKRRLKQDRYNDFCMLPDDSDEEVVFFGGRDYLPLFCKLTENYRGRRFVFYNSVYRPVAPGCALIPYQTTTRTNWHYCCARDFMAGRVTCCSDA